MLKHKFLLVACMLQFVLIAAMFVNAYLPLYFGTEVKVIAKGYDPRDLLAGNFVRLDYGLVSKEPIIGKDKELFVCLEKSDKKGFFTWGEILSQPPQDKLYIRAKRRNTYSDNLLLGVEKYFTSKERAMALEKTLNQPHSQAIVTLKVFRGQARIVDLNVQSLPLSYPDS